VSDSAMADSERVGTVSGARTSSAALSLPSLPGCISVLRGRRNAG
jgi:hypothetical protein